MQTLWEQIALKRCCWSNSLLWWLKPAGVQFNIIRVHIQSLWLFTLVLVILYHHYIVWIIMSKTLRHYLFVNFASIYFSLLSAYCILISTSYSFLWCALGGSLLISVCALLTKAWCVAHIGAFEQRMYWVWQQRLKRANIWKSFRGNRSNRSKAFITE